MSDHPNVLFRVTGYINNPMVIREINLAPLTQEMVETILVRYPINKEFAHIPDCPYLKYKTVFLDLAAGEEELKNIRACTQCYPRPFVSAVDSRKAPGG